MPSAVFALASALVTSAVAPLSTPQSSAQPIVPIVILGTDAVLAALPATPVQLAHACLSAGFANVIPASWGDEIIATAVLRRLSAFGEGPAIQCSCPYVAHRLLTVGADLRPVLLGLVPPPVAIARYVRALSPSTPTRITYVGMCPGAMDESIDIRMTPGALISMLAERQIELPAQPRVFESIIPPDRRRYRSLPGGVPTAEALWAEEGNRSLVEIGGEDFVAEISQLVLGGENVLIDPSAALGCACAGAAGAYPSLEGRHRVMTLEPPRATAPVVQEKPAIDLDLPVPLASRTPVDVVAVPPRATTPPAAPASIDMSSPNAPVAVIATAPERPVSSTMPFGHRISPISGVSQMTDVMASRMAAPAPVMPRPVSGPAPVTRGVEGRSLPRAYVARRRPPVREASAPVVAAPPTPTPQPESPTGSWRASRLRDHPLNPPQAPTYVQTTAAPTPAPMPAVAAVVPAPLIARRWVMLIVVVAVVIGGAAAIGVMVGRSMSRPAASKSPPDTALGYPY